MDLRIAAKTSLHQPHSSARILEGAWMQGRADSPSLRKGILLCPCLGPGTRLSI